MTGEPPRWCLDDTPLLLVKPSMRREDFLYSIAAHESTTPSKQDSVRSPHSSKSAAAMAELHKEGSLEDDKCCACRFGNASQTHLANLHLDISAEGPGPLEHGWHHGKDHTLCLQMSAELAGKLWPVGCLQTIRHICTRGMWSLSSIVSLAGFVHACIRLVSATGA